MPRDTHPISASIRFHRRGSENIDAREAAARKWVLRNERPITTHGTQGRRRCEPAGVPAGASIREARKRAGEAKNGKRERKGRKSASCDLPPPATPTRSSRARDLRGCTHSLSPGRPLVSTRHEVENPPRKRSRLPSRRTRMQHSPTPSPVVAAGSPSR